LYTDIASEGGLASPVLAIVTMAMLRARATRALTAARLSNIVGTVDLMKAPSNPAVVPGGGSTWHIYACAAAAWLRFCEAKRRQASRRLDTE